MTEKCHEEHAAFWARTASAMCEARNTAMRERDDARTQLSYFREKSAQQGAELAQLREAYAALLASRPSDLETLLRASLEPTKMAMGNVSRSPVRAAGEALASLTASDNEVAE